MKSWLKFFGLSFFSDKIAKEARIRGVLNCVLGFALALVFIFCGVLSANIVPFYIHYKNSAEFRNFIYNFVETSNLKVENGLAECDGIINTFKYEADADKYSVNGYNLVIDTRPSDALDAFEAYCTAKDGETEIKYEEYLALDDAAKGNYEFQIRYTDEVLALTDEFIVECGKYLDETENEKYALLKETQTEVAAEEYKNSVYALYVHAYYPEITKFEREGEVPLLRTFYYVNYLSGATTAKGLYIFDNMLAGCFETDGGLENTFYGAFGKNTEGAVTVDGADGFIKQAFQSAVPLSVNVYLFNVFRFIPLIAAIPLVLALVASVTLTLLKDVKFKKYTVCLKIQFAFTAWSALLTAVITFILGFFAPASAVNTLPLAIFAGIMALRTLIFLVCEYINVKKAPAVQEQTQTE